MDFSEQFNLDLEIPNGLIGLRRDTILRLCSLLWEDINEIRAIIGICDETFKWKNHSFFKDGRPIKTPAVFLDNPLGGYTLTVTPLGQQCLFNTDDNRTVFLDKKIIEGAFRWSIKISYQAKKLSAFWVGTADSDHLACFNRVTLGHYGACGMGFGHNDKDLPTGWRDLVSNGCDCVPSMSGVGVDFTPLKGIIVADDSLVTMDFDTDSMTLFFFVNGTTVPHAIGGVRAPRHMGVSSYGKPSFVSVSFQRLPRPSRSRPAVACMVEWREDEHY